MVTTFYTLDGMKSILLPKFVFFRSRLRLSLKNTNLLFYCFILIFMGVALRIITYRAPSGRGPLYVISLRIVGSGFCPILSQRERRDGARRVPPLGGGRPRAMLAPDANVGISTCGRYLPS